MSRLCELTRTLTRLTNFRYQGRPVILQLDKNGLVVRCRPRGRRRWYVVTVEQIFHAGAANLAAALAAAKQKPGARKQIHRGKIR